MNRLNFLITAAKSALACAVAPIAKFLPEATNPTKIIWERVPHSYEKNENRQFYSFALDMTPGDYTEKDLFRFLHLLDTGIIEMAVMGKVANEGYLAHRPLPFRSGQSRAARLLECLKSLERLKPSLKSIVIPGGGYVLVRVSTLWDIFRDDYKPPGIMCFYRHFIIDVVPKNKAIVHTLGDDQNPPTFTIKK